MGDYGISISPSTHWIGRAAAIRAINKYAHCELQQNILAAGLNLNSAFENPLQADNDIIIYAEFMIREIEEEEQSFLIFIITRSFNCLVGYRFFNLIQPFFLFKLYAYMFLIWCDIFLKNALNVITSFENFEFESNSIKQFNIESHILM